MFEVGARASTPRESRRCATHATSPRLRDSLCASTGKETKGLRPLGPRPAGSYEDPRPACAPGGQPLAASAASRYALGADGVGAAHPGAWGSRIAATRYALGAEGLRARGPACAAHR